MGIFDGGATDAHYRRYAQPDPAVHPAGYPAELAVLGVFGNAVCFALWNIAFKNLGVVITNNYLYATPFVTVVVGWLLLGEKNFPHEHPRRRADHPGRDFRQ